MLNVNKIKSDFQIFSEQPELVYLDSGATSLTPNVVADEIADYYKNYRGTVHRSLYSNGIKADQKYNAARLAVANFIGACENEIVFHKSTTSLMNLIARNILKNLVVGDEVLVSEIEHHSTLLPWREIAKEYGVVVKYIPLINQKVTVEGIKQVVSDKTKVIATNHVSNVLGDITDVNAIGKYAKDKCLVFVVDGAQAITHEKVNVKAINCDFYVFSAHKMLGPTGLGISYVNQKYHNQFIFEYGGDMAHLVTKDELTVKEMPVRLEAGTPSIAEVIALKPAIEYLENLGMDNIHQHVVELKKYMVSELNKINGVTIYNPESESGIVTFNLDNIPAHDVLQEYAFSNVAIRGGHMCNQLTLNYLGVYSVLRASIYLYNDKADIDKFIDATKKAIQNLEWML